MTYKHENDVMDAVDVMVKVMGKDKHSEAQQELAEVYRKAEAFDAVLKAYDEALSEGHMADDICNIVSKYRGETNG